MFIIYFIITVIISSSNSINNFINNNNKKYGITPLIKLWMDYHLYYTFSSITKWINVRYQSIYKTSYYSNFSDQNSLQWDLDFNKTDYTGTLLGTLFNLCGYMCVFGFLTQKYLNIIKQ